MQSNQPANHKDIILSVIVPVRNEKAGIKMTINILNATLEDYPFEILTVYDSNKDTTIPVLKKLQKRYPNIVLVLNDMGEGLPNAIKKAARKSRGDILLITPADEVFPIISYTDMLKLMIQHNCGFVSGTRYSLGGKRLGGSMIGALLSRVANFLFRAVLRSPFSDVTTGVKMMKKSTFNLITIESNPVGWAFAAELALKATLLDVRLGEAPIIAIDRIFGGQSSFRLLPWVFEYARWFFWGLKNIWKFINKSKKETITILDKHKKNKVFI